MKFGLKLKIIAFIGLALAVTVHPAAAQVLYGTTLGSKQLVTINTQTNVVTPLETANGTPDSLTLFGNCIIYDDSDVGDLREYCPGTPATDTLLAQGLSAPQDLVLEPSGSSVLVSNYLNGKITRVNLNGPFPNSTTLTTVTAPEGLAYDNVGRLFVNEGSTSLGTCSGGGGTSVIQQLNPTNGAVIATSTGFDPTNSLDGLLFDPYTNDLWATSKCGGTIYQIDPSTLNVLNSYSVGATSYPDGLATNGHGLLFLVLRNDPTAGTNAEIASFNIATQTLTPGVTVPGLDDLAQVISGPPTNTKSFSPSVIPLGSITTLTITIVNPNPQTLTGVAFTDNLPSQVTVANPNGLVNNCGGTVTANPGATSVALSAGVLPGPANTTCTISVSLTGVLTGTGTNSISVTSTEGGAGPNTCPTQTPCPSITVIAPPSITKSPATFTSGKTGAVTFTITNPASNMVSLTGVGFTDQLPAAVPPGLTFTGTPTATGCGATPVISPANTITLTNGTIGVSPNNTCTIMVSVTGTNNTANPVQVTNVTGFVNSTNGGMGNQAMALITVNPPPPVNAPPTITKSFNPSTIIVGQTAVLSFTITNPNSNPVLSSLQGISFTDTLPGVIQVASPNGATPTPPCNGTGTLTATPGSGTVSLSGATLALNASCTFSVTVIGLAPGGMGTNSVQACSTSSTPACGNTSMVPINVATLNPPMISKSFNPTTINIGQTAVLTFTITNPNTNMALPALMGIAFSDTLPSVVQVATPNGATPTPPCNGSGTLSAPPGGSSVALSGATLALNTSCTFSVTVVGLAPGGGGTNSVQVTATNSTPTTGNTAMAPINVVPQPTGTKSFNPQYINPGGTSTITFVISNPASSPITLMGLAFTDTLPADLVVATPNNISPPAGPYCGGTVTAVSGSTSIALSGGTLAPGASCTFNVDVLHTGTVPENLTNCITVTSTNGPSSTQSCTVLTVQSPIPEDAYQINYIPNLNIGDGQIDLTNAGALGADPYGPASGTHGYICANVYAFSPDEQEISCCSCLITPNGLVHLSATNDLLPNTLTGVKPSSIVVKLLATVPGSNGAPGSLLTPPYTQKSCNAAYPFGTDNLTSGLRAWATKLHALPTTPTSYGMAETDFQRGWAADFYLLAQPPFGSPTPLSPGELAKLTGLCQFISGNGSGAGICNSCSLGGN